MGSLNVPAFRPAESTSGVGANLLSELVRWGLQKSDAASAKTALEQLMNPPREVASTKEVPLEAEPQGPVNQDRSLLGEVLEMPPSKTETIPTKEMIAPKPGDTDYKTAPAGLSPDVYNAVAKSEITPTIDRLAAPYIAAGLPVPQNILDYQQSKRGGGVSMQKVEMPDGTVKIVGVPKKAGVSEYTPYTAPVVKNEIVGVENGVPVTANRAYSPTNLTKPPVQLGQTTNPAQSQATRAAENAKYRFHAYYDPQLGREVPMSDYEIRQKVDNNRIPVTAADAKRMQPVLGKTAEVFLTLHNTREAAERALAANGGELKFDNTQIAELSTMLDHAVLSNDAGILRNYLNGLVNAASDEPTRNYVNNLKTMYEALIPLNSMLGGTAQTSDMRYKALLAAAPGPSDVRMSDIDGKIQRLENTLALSTSELPSVKGPSGFSIQDLSRDMFDRRSGKRFDQSLIGRLVGAQHAATPGVGVIPQQQSTQVPSLNSLENVSTEELLKRL